MKTTCYLIISENGSVELRKRRPDLSSGQVAVKLRLDISDRFFERFIPDVEMTIPDEAVIEPEIEVTYEVEEDDGQQP